MSYLCMLWSGLQNQRKNQMRAEHHKGREALLNRRRSSYPTLLTYISPFFEILNEELLELVWHYPQDVFLWQIPPWSGEINLPSKSFNLLARSFVRILYEALHSEIGRNPSKEEGLISFGIRARKVELVAPPTLDFFWKADTRRRRFDLLIGQQTL